MFKFNSIQWMGLFWLIPGLIFLYLLSEWRRAKKTGRLFSPSIRTSTILGLSPVKRGLKAALVFLALAGIIVALLRPQWGYEIREVKRKGVDIFVLLDTSDSMRAEDIQPNRIQRAKRELIDLMNLLRGDRIGLIPFAGRAYVACPLTTDYSAFHLFIDPIDTDLIPIQGTNLAEAVRLAIDSFDAGSTRSRAIIIMTDGEATSGEMAESLSRAKKEGVAIYVIGMGRVDGAPIPLKDGDGFKKDTRGEVVISKLDETSLKAIAVESGGVYVRSVTGDGDLEQIYLRGIRQDLESQEIESGQKMIPEERFQIPLALALILLMGEGLLKETAALSTRTRVLKWVLIVLIQLCWARPALALDPWTLDRAKRLYGEGLYEKALEEYKKLDEGSETNPLVYYNMGDSSYQLGDYDGAERHFISALNADDPKVRERSLYNLGNTKYRQGHLNEALDYYNKVLEANPNNKKAELNRDFVLKKMRDQPPDKGQDEGGKGDLNDDQEEKQGDGEEEKKEEDKGKESRGEETGEKKGREEKEGEKPGSEKDGEEESELTPREEARERPDDGSKLSRKEADQWLESLEEDPKGAIRDMILRESSGEKPPPEEDW